MSTARHHRIPLDLAAMRADYESGLSLTDTARKHFVSHGTVQKRLYEMGVAMRPPGRPNKTEPEGYWKLQKTGNKETNS